MSGSSLITAGIVICFIVTNLHKSFSQQLGNNQCINSSSSEYFNRTSNECTPCTRCEDTGLLYFANCTSTSNSICYKKCPQGQYYSNTTGQCTVCSNCTTGLNRQCTAISDTVCHMCANEETQIYNNSTGICITDCSKCKHGCTPDNLRCNCDTGEYYNNQTSSCTPCTTCPNGQFSLEECSAYRDSVCQDLCPSYQFYNRRTGSCTACTNCSDLPEVECSATNDATCCPEKEFFNVVEQICTPDCLECPGTKECDGNQCKCEKCKYGRLCEYTDESSPGCAPTEPPKPSDPPPTRPTEASSASISPVTSALIALGAVVGIILFSALFVLLGVVSSCNRGQGQSDATSNNSTERFLEEAKATSALISMYKQNSITFDEYKTSIDLMRLTGSGRSLNSSSNSGSPRNSPRLSGVQRSSPLKYSSSSSNNNRRTSPISV